MTDERHTITDPHAIEEIDQLRAQVVSLKAELAAGYILDRGDEPSGTTEELAVRYDTQNFNVRVAVVSVPGQRRKLSGAVSRDYHVAVVRRWASRCEAVEAKLADRATASKVLVEQIGRREEEIKAGERMRIAAGIEDQHRPGSYPYEMAKAIRENKTPDGHPLSPSWHTHEVHVAAQKARALCIDMLRRRAHHGRALAGPEGLDPSRALEASAYELAAKYLEDVT